MYKLKIIIIGLAQISFYSLIFIIVVASHYI